VSYCPKCGSKLFLIARGSFSGSSEADDRKITEIAQLGERLSKALEESRKGKGWGKWLLDVDYVVCVPCECLYMVYGKRGYYFDILGSLTDYTMALLVAGGIKGEKEK